MAQKTDNHNLRAKLELRRYFLNRENFNKPISVCDCFSGSEVLWSKLRKEFQIGEYLALDVKPKRGRLKIDSLRYLQNQDWNHDVIDLDAYGSPWRHFFEVVKRNVSCLVFLTVANTVWKQQQSEAVAATGITFPIPAALNGQLDEIILEHGLVAPLRSGLTIAHAAEALNPGGSARYIGMKISSKQTPSA